MTKVAITGSRYWKDCNIIKEALTKITKNYQSPYTLIVGDAKGADMIGAQIASQLKFKVVIHKANWDKYGYQAGPIRNQKIIDDQPDILLVFPLPESRGTWNTVNKAKIYNKKNKKQIKIIVYSKYLDQASK